MWCESLTRYVNNAELAVPNRLAYACHDMVGRPRHRHSVAGDVRGAEGDPRNESHPDGGGVRLAARDVLCLALGAPADRRLADTEPASVSRLCGHRAVPGGYSPRARALRARAVLSIFPDAGRRR